jgi:uncharacterized circularly permuted ATP-grasp superfamily protein
MYLKEGAGRVHYQRYARWLERQPPELLTQKRAEADALFHRVGITFAVYGQEKARNASSPSISCPACCRARNGSGWTRA